MRALIISAIVAAALYIASIHFWMGEGLWVQKPDDPIPDIPVRIGNRACCAFGKDVRASFAGINIPLVSVSRVGKYEELGPHRYDASFGALDDPRDNAFPMGEANVLIYTCRGGFIDTAHLREPVDWIAFFIAKLDRHLEQGTVIELPVEGAERRVVVKAIPKEMIRQSGRDEILIAISQWLSYQLSIWHEVVQWYGVSMLKSFPETASGFSLEDAYSNAVGLRLMDGVDFRTHFVSEMAYNNFIDALLVEGIEALQPVPQEVGERALVALDQIWWDSTVRLPHREIVLRRYLDTDNELSPWLFPDKFASPELRAQLEQHCGPKPEPLVVQIPDSLAGFAFDDYVTLEFRQNGLLDGIPVFEALGPRFDQSAFPKVMAAAAADVREKLGPRGHLPD